MPSYEEYQDLPRYVLQRHFPDRLEDEDLLQEGRLELWLSILDAGKVRSNFFNYAYKRILRRYYRILKGQTVDFVPMDDDPADENSTAFEDSKDLCASIGHIIKNSDEAKVLCLKAKGYTFREIAQKMGKNYNTVRRLARRGGEKLRNHGAL